MLPSKGKPLTPGQVEGLRALAKAYWQNRHPASLAPRPWEHDPVITRGGRARRALITLSSPISALRFVPLTGAVRTKIFSHLNKGSHA